MRAEVLSALAFVAACTPLAPGDVPFEGAPCASSAEAVDVYVDVRAEVGGTGSAACPWPSITRALAELDGRTGVTIHVAEGTYEAPAEQFPLELRGVRLVGAGEDRTVLRGIGTFLTLEPGRDTLVDYPATIVIGHESLPSGVAEVALVSTATAVGSAILCERGSATEVGETAPPPDVDAFVDRVRVAPGFAVAVVVTTGRDTTARGCHLRLLGSRISGAYAGVWSTFTAGARRWQSVTIGDGTDAGANDFSEFAEWPNLEAAAIVLWDWTAYARIDGNRIHDVERGIATVAHAADLRGVLEIEGNTLERIEVVGVQIGRAKVARRFVGNVLRDVTASRPDERAIALVVDGRGAPIGEPGGVAYARDNVVVGNDLGVVVLGSETIADFGDGSDPGRNVLRCNSTRPSASLPGADVVIERAAGSAPLPFVGNAWDHVPPVVSRDGTNGDDVALFDDPRVDLDDASIATEPCPDERRE